MATSVKEGIGIALSGGGYRAMLFHVGALKALNELGILSKAARISSVSGGSITSAWLALCWPRLVFKDGVASNFELVEVGLRRMAGVTVDFRSILMGFFTGSISSYVAAAYDKILFQGAKLADLPEAPEFVINATNVQTGVRWRFARAYMGDYRTGLIENPDMRLAIAVASSSAFPPVLSPMQIQLTGTFTKPGDLSRPPFTTDVVLCDGGVYDNLGVEGIRNFSTIYVSDAGQELPAQPSPHRDWGLHSLRILEIIYNQVAALHKRWLMAEIAAGTRKGAYWSVRSSPELAATPTRLDAISEAQQLALIAGGYAAAMAELKGGLA